MKSLEQLTHYEVLELEPGASHDDVQKAFDRLRQVFAPGSLATYSLVDTFDQQRMAARLEEAFTVLADPAARAAYDQRNELVPPLPPSVDPPPVEPRRDAVLRGEAATRAELTPGPRAEYTPGPPPPEPTPPEPAAKALPPMPEIAADASFTGELLRKVREARGLTVRQVADITRIGANYLQSIEQEAFEKLPERVYLRGFLISYARELRLDPNRVASSYLTRWEAGRSRN